MFPCSPGSYHYSINFIIMKKKSFLQWAVLTILVLFTASESTFAQKNKTDAEITSINAPTRFVLVNGNEIAYRRFGKKAGLPLVFIQHFTGTLENWDPAVLDGMAKTREVIIFDNTGVGSSTGKTPDNIADNAKDVAAFVYALGLKKIDLLGFSMGGMQAQQVTLDHPDLVNRLVLVGTAPRGGEGSAVFSAQVMAMFAETYKYPDEILLKTLFLPTETSQKAGRAFLERIRARKENRDMAINSQVAPAQTAAIKGWGEMSKGNYAYLKAIKQPTLVVMGKDDVIFPSVNGFILQQNLPDAYLIMYPDSSHGVQDQFPNLFVTQLTIFLNGMDN